jgi:hypothetical protein
METSRSIPELVTLLEFTPSKSYDEMVTEKNQRVYACTKINLYMAHGTHDIG